MAQTKEQIKSAYPLPAYNYRVTVNTGGESLALSFAEISGLSLAYEPVTYKHGMSYLMGDKIIPGMRQPIRLTLKRGISQSRAHLYQWMRRTYQDLDFENSKRDVLIDLCDESGAPVIQWVVQGALPIKLDAPTFDAKSNEVAIESIELIAHGLSVDYNP